MFYFIVDFDFHNNNNNLFLVLDNFHLRKIDRSKKNELQSISK